MTSPTKKKAEFRLESKRGVANKTSPLAREYGNTTIFFGDLAGFTQWSSSRSPEQVFELLETLYQTFDDIAKKRGVFKVETIGDCYGKPSSTRELSILVLFYIFLTICFLLYNSCRHGSSRTSKEPRLANGPLRHRLHDEYVYRDPTAERIPGSVHLVLATAHWNAFWHSHRWGPQGRQVALSVVW